MTRHVSLKRRAALVTSCVDMGELPLVSLDILEPGIGRMAAGPTRVSAMPDAGAALVAPGDVLFGKLRPYLAKSTLVAEPAYASTELLAIRPGSELDSRFFAYVVQARTFIDWTVATSEGTKMPRTSWEKVGSFELRDISRAAQRGIADFLDTETARIDALISKKRRMVGLLQERHADAVETAIQGLAAQYGIQPLKRSVEAVTVGIVVTPSEWYADHGVLALRGLNVRPGSIETSEVVYLTDEGHRLHAKSELRAGDVVVVRTGQAGAAAVVPPELHGANCIDLLIVRPGTMDSTFLSFVLNSDWAQKHIANHSVGSIQSHFNVGALRELPVPAAPEDAQSSVATRLMKAAEQHLALNERLTRQIALLKEHRQALITAAVTGELKVPGVAA